MSLAVLALLAGGVWMASAPPAYAGGWCGWVICPGDIVADFQKLARNIAIAAQKAAAFAKESGQNIQKYQQQIKTILAYDEGFGATQNVVEKTTALKLAAKEAESKAQADRTNFKAAAAYHTSAVAQDSSIVAKAVGPDQTNDILCYTIAARQMIPAMFRFKNIIKNWITKGIMGEQLGNGPYYINFVHQMSCGKLNSGDPSYNSNDPSCGSTASGTAGSAALEGANISFDTLTPGQTTLIMPPLVSKTVTLPSGTKMSVVVPEVQSGADQERQQLWIAARDYCYNLVGPHPDAPSGKALDTPEGRRKMAAYSNCASMQSSYVDTCSDAVAYITRPNCSNDDFKPFCEKAKQGCQAAFAHNVVLPASFDQCNKGLSLYEAEYISNILCMSQGRAAGATAGGATSAALDPATSLCLRLQSAWQREQAQRRTKLLRAAKGLNDLRSCWKQVE